MKKSVKAKSWLWLEARRIASSDVSKSEGVEPVAFRRGGGKLRQIETRGVSWTEIAVRGLGLLAVGPAGNSTGLVGSGV